MASAMNACKAIPSRLPRETQRPNRRAIEAKKTQAAYMPWQAGNKNRTRRSLLFLSLPMSALLLLPSNSAATPSPGFDPVTDAERDASSALSRRVGEAVRLLDLAREFQAKGDFPQALDYYNQIINDYKDLAFTEYARVGRALLLYEIGDREQAITEMEDVSISLKGYPVMGRRSTGKGDETDRALRASLFGCCLSRRKRDLLCGESKRDKESRSSLSSANSCAEPVRSDVGRSVVLLGLRVLCSHEGGRTKGKRRREFRPFAMLDRIRGRSHLLLCSCPLNRRKKIAQEGRGLFVRSLLRACQPIEEEEQERVRLFEEEGLAASWADRIRQGEHGQGRDRAARCSGRSARAEG